ncbi:hypothetical protein M9H77_18592 [Catharanthus roseus]|uniref:Uncharacterized protein n=1 Tax=Catharanthus roseus TaxID=4058 RepID=A0ACC0B7X9_CATRO|nr:hypothetical protein M9H77_18592 [Catharanthus roseus]
MSSPGTQQTRFYLCVIHSESNTIIWSANGDAPVSTSGKMSLTSSGITITEEDDGNLKWSTPFLGLPVSALQLTEGGNLLLLDQSNTSLWESYNQPTDTIVIGQSLPAGKLLFSSVSDDDLSKGDYSLTLTASDAILQWRNLTYWKLSMEAKAVTNTYYAVGYMTVNETGLFLFSQNGSAIVISMNLSPSGFRTVKLDYSGQFIITSFMQGKQNQDFIGPSDACKIPYICSRLGLCTNSDSQTAPVCSCPSNFIVSSQNSSHCVPSDSSYSLPLGCNTTNDNRPINSSSVSYMRLGYGIDYFANDFIMPIRYGINLSVCQDLCSGDCTCFGVFYKNSSGSCYILLNNLGSIILRRLASSDQIGYIKVFIGPKYRANTDLNGRTLGFPLVAVVLLPSTGLCLLITLGFILWRRSRVPARWGKVKSSQSNSTSSADLDVFSIPGLPTMFEYEELEAATENFKIQVGSGGFGSVYKGILPDKTLVAVKKINNLGIDGKKDFCTEIAVIGNIHHVNLVKLKGYCAQGRHRLLVYEYMNRGSLDRSLFAGGGPVLEWQERVEIALGAARGLAYLHSGCEHKIIHCDIKPENILLHDQFQAKLSDFGLSKLLSPEQSSHFTTMRGTRGYLAPEWLTSSAISEKTDVYSFGMVLLEIVSGRKNCPSRSRSHSLDDSSSAGGCSSSSSTQGLVYFPLFALEMHEQKRYLELADPRLEGRVTFDEVEKFVRVALCCVHEEPSRRPNMATVIGMLEGEIPLSDPRLESLHFLRFYGHRFAEASTIEESRGQQNDFAFYPQESTPQLSGRSASNTCFSYISSQQISGPR